MPRERYCAQAAEGAGSSEPNGRSKFLMIQSTLLRIGGCHFGSTILAEMIVNRHC